MRRRGTGSRRQRKSLKAEIGGLERTLREGHDLYARRAAALDKDYEEAQRALPDEREALKKAEGELQQWRETLDIEVKGREAQKAELVAMPEVEAKLAAAQKESNSIRPQAGARAAADGSSEGKDRPLRQP